MWEWGHKARSSTLKQGSELQRPSTYNSDTMAFRPLTLAARFQDITYKSEQLKKQTYEEIMKHTTQLLEFREQVINKLEEFRETANEYWGLRSFKDRHTLVLPYFSLIFVLHWCNIDCVYVPGVWFLVLGANDILYVIDQVKFDCTYPTLDLLLVQGWLLLKLSWLPQAFTNYSGVGPTNFNPLIKT
jgi:hypothetical protein